MDALLAERDELHDRPGAEDRGGDQGTDGHVAEQLEVTAVGGDGLAEPHHHEGDRHRPEAHQAQHVEAALEELAGNRLPEEDGDHRHEADDGGDRTDECEDVGKVHWLVAFRSLDQF